LVHFFAESLFIMFFFRPTNGTLDSTGLFTSGRNVKNNCFPATVHPWMFWVAKDF